MSFSSCIIGEGTLPVQCAEILLRRGHRIRGIISPDAACIRWAQERNIPHADTRQDLVAFLRAQPFDLLFSIVNQTILPGEVLALPRQAAINYHDGPLPRYAGTYATSWALMNRERMHGITWHRIVEEVDAGEVLKQRLVEITEGETAVTLNVKCYEAAIAAFGELVEELEEGRAVGRPQDLSERTYNARHQRPASAGVISWKRSAEEISALVRALDFGPYENALGLAKVKVGEAYWLVREMTVTDTPSTATPGTMISLAAGGIRVSTGSRDVVLRRVQSMEGAEEPLEQLINQHGLQVGAVLPELSAEAAERLTALNGEICKQERYWVKRLAGLEALPVPYGSGGVRQTDKSGGVGSVAVRVPESWQRIGVGENVGGKRGHLLLAAFGAFLSRVGGMVEFDIGCSSTELRNETTGFHGLFAQCVPLHFAVDGSQPLDLLWSELKDRLEALHRRKTFVADVWARFPSLRASAARSARGALPVAVEFVESLERPGAIADAALTLRIAEAGEPCQLEFNPALVDESTVRRIAAHFEIFLSGIAANPTMPVGDLPLLTEAERRTVLGEWNQTESPFPADETIHACFAGQLERTPDAPAVTFRNQTWTFRQLDARAGEIAGRLRAAGARRETIVALCVERSLDMVAGILGILKADAGYLPLDPAYPAGRIADMVEDAKPVAVLASGSAAAGLAEIKSPIIHVAECGRETSPTGLTMPEGSAPAADASSLAYVIYTSGSTGKPKGVMVEHRNAMNFFTALDRLFSSERGVVLGVTSVSFDPSVHEILWSLTRGYHLVLWPGVAGDDDATIPALIREHRVTLMLGVPSLYRMILGMSGGRDALASVRHLVVGGEALTGALLASLGDPVARRMVNMYGPTETTVAATAWRGDPSAPTIPIGRPLANTRLYVLDRRLQPVPPGVAGELFIGGAGVARGYLNRPKLTQERFVPNPFNGAIHDRLYRTGDLVRWRQDGILDYLGRADDQVKIRGHRVELGEVEARLCKHPGVHAGVTDVQRDKSGENRLVAYVVTGTENLPTTKEFREWMSCELPAYMVPAAFVKLDALPRTANGKLDRRALPPPETVRAPAPLRSRTLTPIEAGLSEIWCETLGVERVGLEETFFEIGGNSLMAVNLMLAIEERHGMRLPLEVVLEAPTVALLARKLEELTGGPRPAAPEVFTPGPGRYVAPRTATERRLHAIWERLLKARPLGIRDSFIELQEHSTILDQMLIETKREFGGRAEGFPLDAFSEEPTIEALARNIDANIEPAASLVICLQPHGSKPALFLIHDGGGNVFFYRILAARLGTDRPIYGIRAESNADGFPCYRAHSVEGVAARYIAEIKLAQPRGPYALGGYCLGGVIAFEMARQLRLQGDEVSDPVLLFDAYMQNNPHLRTEEGVPILQRAGLLPPDTRWTALRRHLSNQLKRASQLGLMNMAWQVAGKILREAPSKAVVVIRALTRSLRVLPARLAGKFGPKAAATPRTLDAVERIRRRLVEEFQPASGHLLAKYVPDVYPGSLVLFKAKDTADLERLWTGLAQVGMVVHEIPGGHLDMLEEPAVITTAALVQGHL
ncbi:MAG: amino acid adenylation domain-containing protein [Verrucomicrobia bacterium]|nr:amino acid adenylation domain-containing protein [Verrucomicrobiota bacterium]